MGAGQKFFRGIIDKATAQGTGQIVEANDSIVKLYGQEFFNKVTGFFGNTKGAEARFGRQFGNQKNLVERLMPYGKRLSQIGEELKNYKTDSNGNLMFKNKEGKFEAATDAQKNRYDSLNKRQARLDKAIKYNLQNGASQYNPKLLSGNERFASMFLDDEGKYSALRIAGGIAGSYMAANIVGHGSLGIPLISTASWNR